MRALGFPVDLPTTMESGQPPHFLWTRTRDAFFERKMHGIPWRLAQGEARAVRTDARFLTQANRLFRAKDNLAEIRFELSADGPLRAALSSFPHLRLTQSDPWEALVCYLTSSNNHIPRIRSLVRSLVGPGGEVLPPEEISETDLRKKGFGYRSEYLRKASALIARGEFDLPGVASLPYETARTELQTLPGVGPKVADCILLYGFGFLESFPQDVWVKRAMKEHYRLSNEKKVAEYAGRKWGEFAGYAQHYLFWQARTDAAADSLPPRFPSRPRRNAL